MSEIPEHLLERAKASQKRSAEARHRLVGKAVVEGRGEPTTEELSPEQRQFAKEAEAVDFTAAKKKVALLLRQGSETSVSTEYDPAAQAVDASITHSRTDVLGNLLVSIVHRRDYREIPSEVEPDAAFWDRNPTDIQADLDRAATATRTHDVVVHAADHPFKLGYQVKVTETHAQGEEPVVGALIGVPDKTDASLPQPERPTSYLTDHATLEGFAQMFGTRSSFRPEGPTFQQRIISQALDGIGAIAEGVGARSPEVVETYLSGELVPALALIKADIT